jgi:hypothetical protein
MTLAKRLLFTATLGAATLASSVVVGQNVVTSADYGPTVGGGAVTTEVAYRPFYGRRGYYGGYYAPYRAYYRPRSGYYNGRWGSNYRPYYNGYGYSRYRGYGYPGYGNGPYYGYRYARPTYTYGWGW